MLEYLQYRKGFDEDGQKRTFFRELAAGVSQQTTF